MDVPLDFKYLVTRVFNGVIVEKGTVSKYVSPETDMVSTEKAELNTIKHLLGSRYPRSLYVITVFRIKN